MVALQGAIGTVNDLVDVPGDAGRKSGKPLPRGLVSRRAAAGLAVGLAVVGLALSALSGLARPVGGRSWARRRARLRPRLKGTVWSWLPFAVGVPLLPVYRLARGGREHPARVRGLLLPAATAAAPAWPSRTSSPTSSGIGLRAPRHLATRLGVAQRAGSLNAALMLGVLAVAAVSLVTMGGRGWGVVLVAVGAVSSSSGSAWAGAAAPRIRERAWECQAAGIGIVGAGWVWALAEAGAL